MKVIYKYPFNTIMSLPKGAVVLSVKKQRDDVCLWAIIDTDETEYEFKKFAVYGTGYGLTIPEERLKFVDTILLENDNLVYHFFEVVENE